MANLDKLQNSIMDVIKDDNYDIDDLKKILGDVSECTENSVFVTNLTQVMDIMTKDRDGNNKFDINDLTLMSKDIIAMTSLITAILLLVASIPNFKLQYNEGASEEFVFKLLAYIFLVIVPKQTGHKWTLQEKQSIIELVLIVYQLIISSQVTKELIIKITAWFKSKGWCNCMTASTATKQEDILAEKLPAVNRELSYAMNNVRDKSEMQAQITNIERKLKSKNKKKLVRTHKLLVDEDLEEAEKEKSNDIQNIIN